MNPLEMQQAWERFAYALDRLFRSWTALQIAVEQGFGGVRSAAKAQDLQRDVITFFRVRHGSVHPDELEDELADKLDEKFNLLLEDGSLEEISRKVVMLFALLERGDVATFDREVARISGSANTAASVAVPEAEDIVMDDAEMLSEVMEEMNIQPGNAGEVAQEGRSASANARDATPRRPRNQPDEDGWTVVSGSGKRKSNP